MGNYKMFKLAPDETRDFLLWALRVGELDTIVTYLDLPKVVLKEAELFENELFNELRTLVTQALSKYIDAKHYNVVDRQRVRNLALVITLIKRKEGVILDLTHGEIAVFRRACREGALRTPCQFI